MLKLGLESGDERVLDAMQKGINLGEAFSFEDIEASGYCDLCLSSFGTRPAIS